MARFKRIRQPGLLHHVMSRGNGRMKIFLDDRDCRKFLYVLSDVLDEYNVDCWDFCVMQNHYHLTVMNQEPNLPEAMQHLNGEYATWWNGRHGKVGHTLQGRYKDQIVQRDTGYLGNLFTYIAMNPVRARLVTSPELWPWSAYRHAAGFKPSLSFIRSDLVLAEFGDGEPEILRERYRRHVLGATNDDNERYAGFRSRMRVLGERQFKRQVLRELSLPTKETERVTTVAQVDYVGSL
jgi:REP element-mobilizing transposase RayT